jgi:hypothetical protein
MNMNEKLPHNQMADAIGVFLQTTYPTSEMTTILNALIGLLTNIAAQVGMPREVFLAGTAGAFDNAVAEIAVKALNASINKPTIQ